MNKKPQSKTMQPKDIKPVAQSGLELPNSVSPEQLPQAPKLPP